MKTEISFGWYDIFVINEISETCPNILKEKTPNFAFNTVALKLRSLKYRLLIKSPGWQPLWW